MVDVSCPLHTTSKRTPEAAAILSSHREYRYKDYDACVAATSERLSKAGIAEGDLVAIALPQGVDYPILLMALFRLGAVACPLNPKFPSQYMLDILEKIACRSMVVPYGTSSTTKLGGIQTFSPRDLVKEGDDAPGESTFFAVDRPAAIVLTSGSSGTPKAALLSYGNLHANAERSNTNIPLTPGDCWLLSLPLQHVAGLSILFRALLGGAAVAIPSHNESMTEAILRYGVTHISLVPTQLYRLIRDGESLSALKKLKVILVGGGAIPETLVTQAHRAGLALYTTYGLTEMASQVTTSRPGEDKDRLMTSGLPLDPGSIRISKEGEILVDGDTLFLGYVEGTEATRTVDDDGYFATGDLGVLDYRGYLHVQGRRDNMFIAGGENIQPEEIEMQLGRLEGILEGLVVPVPHAEFGATPVAFVRLAGEPPEDFEALGNHLTEQLANRLPEFKIPKRYFAWPEGEDAGLKPNRKAFVAIAEELMGAGDDGA